jgi:hypothetical protein
MKRDDILRMFHPQMPEEETPPPKKRTVKKQNKTIMGIDIPMVFGSADGASVRRDKLNFLAKQVFDKVKEVIHWDDIIGVPLNVQNAMPTTGGRFTNSVDFSNAQYIRWYTASGSSRKGFLYLSPFDIFVIGDPNFKNLIRGSTVIFDSVVPQTNASQGTDPDELTRKDYVDAGDAKLEARIIKLEIALQQAGINIPE